MNEFLRTIAKDENEAAESDLKKRMTMSLIFMAAQIAIALAATENRGLFLFAEGILLAVLIFINIGCFTDAFRSIQRRQPEKNLLATIGVVFAVAFLQLVAAGAVLTTMAVCRYCEAYIRLKLHSHLTDLMETEPQDTEINEGEIIRIGPDEIVPADGIIVSGGTSIDEEIITGERIPPRKKDGDVVFAGSRNISSEISVRVTRTGDDRVISRIISHISSAIMTKSPKAAKYEKIARWFVVLVAAVALITFILWVIVGADLNSAALTGIAVLIIANPYAFSVGVPMSVLGAVVRGARHGILISSADILEETRDINTIVINKRGTITAGDPEISDVMPYDEDFDLSLAGILEGEAEHPSARMIREQARKMFGDLPKAKQLEYIEGRGIKCEHAGRIYIVGNAAYMEDNDIDHEVMGTDDLFRQGKSLIFFADENKVIGIVALRDVPKPASLKAITQMESLGLDVVMVTGDSRQTAEAIRNEIGIDHIFADILPDQKKDVVEQIRIQRDKIVAMVGDGVRDADAIEAADLGIAIGTGREINIGSADIVLVIDDLLDVVRAMKISRRSVRNLRQSVAFAYVYNTLAVIFAAGAMTFLTGVTIMPVASAVCMCLSQILVTLNSLRIRQSRL